VASLKSEKAALEKKVTSLTNRLSSTQSHMSDEREMSKALQNNQAEWQTKFNKLKDEFNLKQKVRSISISTK